MKNFSRAQKFSLIFILALVLASFWISIAPPESTFATNAEKALAIPGADTLLGRDSLGRDLFYRVLEGAKVSISIGLLSSSISLLIGIFFGGMISVLPRSAEAVCLRGLEILMSLPHLMVMAILFLILQSTLGNQVSELVLITLALGLGSWMPTARITRNLLNAELTKDYIQGAKAIGAGWPRILWKHLFPNVISTLLVFWSLQIPQALLAEGALSFLGFGVKSPHVSWGLLLQEGWRSLANYPHLLLGPSLALFLTVFSLNLLLRRQT